MQRGIHEMRLAEQAHVLRVIGVAHQLIQAQQTASRQRRQRHRAHRRCHATGKIFGHDVTAQQALQVSKQLAFHRFGNLVARVAQPGEPKRRVGRKVGACMEVVGNPVGHAAVRRLVVGRLLESLRR